jgi:hypothetical protein
MIQPPPPEEVDFVANEILGFGRWKAVTEFLDKYPNAVNAGGYFGRTLLYKAAAKGRDSIITLLLNKGADIDGGDKLDMTPLMAAANGGHREAVELLIKKDADLDARDTNGWTALMYAVSCENNDYIVEALLENGADIDARNNRNETALIMAQRGSTGKGMARLLEEAHEKREQMRRKEEAARQKQFLEDTNFSEGLKRAIPAPRPLKSPGMKP